MGIFSSFRISATGLAAERLRMDVIANNIANVNTTRTEDGRPYRRRQVVFQALTARPSRGPGASEAPGQGVAVAAIVEDPSPPRMVYDPGHPDADARGYVAMPNVDAVRELVDMISATRAYEANVTALDAAKTMAMRALDIGRA
ncbi:MAG: flagellar basal body rod protein FlgC [Bacillota bacterium]|nr:flagellar basal body rod protein FlgC [Bacillota bacterium]